MIGVRVDFANQSARLSTNCWEFWEAIASLPSKLSSFIHFKPIQTVRRQVQSPPFQSVGAVSFCKHTVCAIVQGAADRFKYNDSSDRFRALATNLAAKLP